MAQNTYQNQNIKENTDFREQRFKSKIDLENSENQDSELDANYLSGFCEELLKDFRNRDYKNVNEEQKKILANFPNDLEKLLKVLEDLKKEEEKDQEEEQQDSLNQTQDNSLKSKKSAKREQRKIERQAKLKEVSAELFIATCASTKSVDEALKFHKKCNLGVEELNKFNKNGVNPLVAILASGKDVKELDKFLKTAGVDVNYKDKNGNTALHNAAAMGIDTKFVEVLVKNGANINARNDFGMTPLDIAAIKGDDKIADLLVKNGAKSGIAEKFADLGEEKQSESAQKDRKMQEMLKKIKDSQKDNVKEKEGEGRQIKPERQINKDDLVNKERENLKQEKIRQEKIRQERIRQEEIRARLNAEVELAFKMHQERMTKIAKENAAKKAEALAKEQQEQYDRDIFEKQKLELEKWNLEKFNLEKQINETYLSQQSFAEQEKLQLKVEEKLQQNNNLQVDDQQLKTLQPESAEPNQRQKSDPIEQILGVKLSEISYDTINKMLFEAVRKNQSTLSNLLILCGADVNHRESGVSVLEVAESNGNQSLIKTIKDKVFESRNNDNVEKQQVVNDKNVNEVSDKTIKSKIVESGNVVNAETLNNEKVEKPKFAENLNSNILNIDQEKNELKAAVIKNNSDNYFTEKKFVDSKNDERIDSKNSIISEKKNFTNQLEIKSNFEKNMSLETGRPNSAIGFVHKVFQVLKSEENLKQFPSTAVEFITKGVKNFTDAVKGKETEITQEKVLNSGIASLSVTISGSVLHNVKNTITPEKFVELESSSEKGDLKAMKELGIVYLSNPSNKEEEVIGLGLLKNEKFKEDVLVQRALGEFYYHKSSRDSVVENLKESMLWFEKAAQQGDQNAIHNLGAIHYACYTKGFVIESDREQHYTKAKEIFNKIDDKKLAARELGRLENAKEFISDNVKQQPKASQLISLSSQKSSNSREA